MALLQKNGDLCLFWWFCCKEGDNNNIVAFSLVEHVKKVMTGDFYLFIYLFLVLMV
jgi:hypothetical protein